VGSQTGPQLEINFSARDAKLLEQGTQPVREIPNFGRGIAPDLGELDFDAFDCAGELKMPDGIAAGQAKHAEKKCEHRSRSSRFST